MHPILGQKRRTRAYLLAWVPLMIFIAALFTQTGGLSLPVALLLVVPPAVAFAFITLAAWFSCRVLPLKGETIWLVCFAHMVSAAFAAGTWLVLGLLWSFALAGANLIPELPDAWMGSAFQVVSLGFVLYLLSVAVHYLLNEQEQAAEKERQVLELDMLAHQAELKTLRAQVQPHFLFNSLNSISALTTTDPMVARTMCLKLADFFRASLAAGKQVSVPFRKELALVQDYLAIEQVRFGDRLQIEEHVDPATYDVLVPPLLLQPLVENAVKHGIAQRLDGGSIRLAARCDGESLELSIENPLGEADATHKGSGVGLENVRRRVQTLYRGSARMDVREEAGLFQVRLSLPVQLEA